jgi:type IV pilus assembly protein PilA
MFQKLSHRAKDEQGFTLIELLVVILIIAILAAVAIPSFLGQKAKAYDSAAQQQVKTAQTAIETYATSNDGSYTGATVSALNTIEPTLADTTAGATLSAVTPDSSGDGYTVTSTVSGGGSSNGDTFSINRADGGTTTLTCTNTGKGACPASGTW